MVKISQKRAKVKKKLNVLGYRTKKEVFGTEFTLVVRYHPGSYKKQEEMLSETRVIEELEKIRVALVKRGDKEPQFMFETMDLNQMRLFTALELETVLKDS